MSRSTPLSMSLIAGPLTNPVLDGSVSVPGFEVKAATGKTVDANSRQMLQGAFDVAEMSLGTFLKGWEQGRDVAGLPIFTGRRYLHGGAIASAKSGVSRPEDLRGKRVGLPQFWQTSSIWHRGILHQQHDVPQEEVRWFTTREERFEGLEPPPGVEITRLPGERTLDDALAAGEVDAVLGAGRAKLGGDTRPLYPDVAAAEEAYFRASGVFPIMHFVVMRRSLAEQEPELPKALFSAFAEAKRKAEPPAPIDGLPTDETERLFGGDPWRYGLAPNRKVLDTFLDIAHRQHWLRKPVELEQLFVPGAADLEG